ncbi:FtsK/SpoIIIE domain-containing protein [Helicobacter cetorum]|uniref:FtsK/SpoIIIE domain-containing protein n=1 Tax=Helicobacter cetorum TaxID=138563 RepID=UPI000CF13B75|nr:FtsK/SpoIIIE domain-containing protein [Helicobacter cetorum]
MAKIFTNGNEERLIKGIIESLGFSTSLNGSIPPKYFVLRVAINLSLQLEVIPLSDESFYKKHALDPHAEFKGSEYNLEQVIGQHKDIEENYETLLKLMFFIRHEEEKVDFNNEEIFTKALQKYIKRGLYELNNTYNSNRDNFYQVLIDSFKLNQTQNIDIKLNNSSQKAHSYEVENYLKQLKISYEFINKEKCLREDIYKLKLNSQEDISKLNKNLHTFSSQLGLHGEPRIEQIKGEVMRFNLFIPRVKDTWIQLYQADFESDLKKSSASLEKIIFYAGRSATNEPYFLDLKKAPHLFVAGQTGSGKSNFLHVLIQSIERLNVHQKIEFLLIDPKNGQDFGKYENKSNCDVITDMSESGAILEEVVERMQNRFSDLEEKTPLVVVIEELADLIMGYKEVKEPLERLAQKARSANIFLILATQNPSSEMFSSILKSNIPTRAVFQVTDRYKSKIALDCEGAEKLLGFGEYLLKSQELGNEKLLKLFTPLIKD